MCDYQVSTDGPFYYGQDYSTSEITKMAKTVQSMDDKGSDSLIAQEEWALLDMLREKGSLSKEEERLAKNLLYDHWFLERIDGATELFKENEKTEIILTAENKIKEKTWGFELSKKEKAQIRADLYELWMANK